MSGKGINKAFIILQFRASVPAPCPLLCAGFKYAVNIFLDNAVLFRLFF
jgi:hypothetical protein